MPERESRSTIRTKGLVVNLNNEDKAKKELDELLIQVGRAIDEDEAGLHIVNPKRMREFLVCGEAMKMLFSDSGYVRVSPHDMYPSAGTIEVITRKLKIRDIELFTLATGLASNYEVYPKLDGTIVLALMFYGLTKKVKE